MPFSEKKKERPDISIVPLINVVFLLLIFFLVSGTGGDPEELPIDMPYVDSGTTIQDTELKVQITKQGRVFIEGRPVSLEGFEVSVKDAIGRNGQLPIVVRVDHRLQAKSLIQILRKITEQGGENVLIATREKLEIGAASE